MLGDEMIDEASRKMALVISGKGRAAGMTAHEHLDPAGELTAAPRPPGGRTPTGAATATPVQGVRPFTGRALGMPRG